MEKGKLGEVSKWLVFSGGVSRDGKKVSKPESDGDKLKERGATRRK